MCHAAVKNKSGLFATRFLLGLAETGQFPGVILQMIYWYRPDDMSLRLLYFCNFDPSIILFVTPLIVLDICGNTASVFGGLLAYAFDTVSGAGGLSGWQW